MSSNNARLHGTVKWFNNKAGYGFITREDTEGKEGTEDVFVHHTSLSIDGKQYKYLVQGEKVEFELTKSTKSDKFEHQATNVTGLLGAKLTCQTKPEASEAKKETKETKETTGDNQWTRVTGKHTKPRQKNPQPMKQPIKQPIKQPKSSSK